jgi:septum formation protein
MRKEAKQMNPKIILASTSPWRAALLRSAGLEIETAGSNLDEDILKKEGAAQNWSAPEIAHRLSIAKAAAVAARYKDSYVIGADQMLECDGRFYDKPTHIDKAREQLLSLRGKTHTLFSACVVMQNENILWSACVPAHLTMRHFSDAFLESYLAQKGPAVCQTVGGYQLEDYGIQLFEKVDGDWFTILGLPLLPLLTFFREKGSLLS